MSENPYKRAKHKIEKRGWSKKNKETFVEQFFWKRFTMDEVMAMDEAELNKHIEACVDYFIDERLKRYPGKELPEYKKEATFEDIRNKRTVDKKIF